MSNNKTSVIRYAIISLSVIRPYLHKYDVVYKTLEIRYLNIRYKTSSNKMFCNQTCRNNTYNDNVLLPIIRLTVMRLSVIIRRAIRLAVIRSFCRI